METFKTLADAKKKAGAKIGKMFGQLKFQTKTGKKKAYRKGHNSEQGD